MTSILIVEDSKTAAALETQTVRRITDKQINIVVAKDGNDACIKFDEISFDLVLLDWHMPNKNGLDTLKELRKHNTTVPIIMVTTEQTQTSVVAAMQAGVSDYIIKPFTIESLESKIRHYIEL